MGYYVLNLLGLLLSLITAGDNVSKFGLYEKSQLKQLLADYIALPNSSYVFAGGKNSLVLMNLTNDRLQISKRNEASRTLHDCLNTKFSYY